MKLISLGCSFALGTDLTDASDNQHSLLTWPALIASRYNLEYRCRAHGGRGNLCILDRLLYMIDRRPDALFVVQWTYIDRFDYSDPEGAHFNLGLNDWCAVLPGRSDALTKTYFKNLHSEYRDKISALAYIQMAIQALESRGCRYVMTCVDDLLWCEKYHCSPGINSIQRWTKSRMCDFEGKNFIAWSQHKGFEISKQGHPLENAHAAAAVLMEPVIDAILRKA